MSELAAFALTVAGLVGVGVVIVGVHWMTFRVIDTARRTRDTDPVPEGWPWE